VRIAGTTARIALNPRHRHRRRPHPSAGEPYIAAFRDFL
jgi:hypothetical protein